MDSNFSKELTIKSEPIDWEEHSSSDTIKEDSYDNSNDSSSQCINLSREYASEVPDSLRIEEEHNEHEGSNCQGELNVKTEHLEQNPEPVDFGVNWLSYDIKDEIVENPDRESSSDAMTTSSGKSNVHLQSSNNAQDWSFNNILNKSGSPTTALNHLYVPKTSDVLAVARIKSNKESSSGSVQDINFNQQNNASSFNISVTKKLTKDEAKKKSYPCEVCNSIFTAQANLKRHLKIHLGGKPFKCDICHNSFTRNSHLKAHLMSHSGDKPFRCVICHNSFTSNSDYKRHLRSHSGEKPFQCSICHSAFTQNSHLKSHLMSHSKSKPFACSVCHKSFTRNSDLKRHLRIHSGEKPFGCNICNKSFTRNSNFKKHFVIHTGKAPLQCDICI